MRNTLKERRKGEGKGIGVRARVLLARFHRAADTAARESQITLSGWSLINLFLCIFEYARAWLLLRRVYPTLFHFASRSKIVPIVFPFDFDFRFVITLPCSPLSQKIAENALTLLLLHQSCLPVIHDILHTFSTTCSVQRYTSVSDVNAQAVVGLGMSNSKIVYFYFQLFVFNSPNFRIEWI